MLNVYLLVLDQMQVKFSLNKSPMFYLHLQVCRCCWLIFCILHIIFTLVTTYMAVQLITAVDQMNSMSQ